MRRRDFLPALAASAALAQTPAPQMKKGRLKQCVTGGVFARGTSLEDGCKLAASLGIVGYDLKGSADWPTIKKYSLASQTLTQVQDALRRIEAATYGKCIDCGRQIEPARLQAIPWSSYCLEDQEKQDKAAHVQQSGSTI